MAASGHGFLSQDTNLDDVIAAFDELETGGDTDLAQEDTED
jgi:cold shock CspA family protein